MIDTPIQNNYINWLVSVITTLEFWYLLPYTGWNVKSTLPIDKGFQFIDNHTCDLTVTMSYARDG